MLAIRYEFNDYEDAGAFNERHAKSYKSYDDLVNDVNYEFIELSTTDSALDSSASQYVRERIERM